jgi:hypothetical protein
MDGGWGPGQSVFGKKCLLTKPPMPRPLKNHPLFPPPHQNEANRHTIQQLLTKHATVEHPSSNKVTLTGAALRASDSRTAALICLVSAVQQERFAR